MKTYLSTQPVWINPTPDIRALDGKSIVVANEGSRTSAHLRIGDADPAGKDAGMGSIIAWQASMSPMNAEWTDTGSTPPTSQAHQWERYLTQDALPLIKQNEEDPEFGELLLEVPAQA